MNSDDWTTVAAIAAVVALVLGYYVYRRMPIAESRLETYKKALETLDEIESRAEQLDHRILTRDEARDLGLRKRLDDLRAQTKDPATPLSRDNELYHHLHYLSLYIGKLEDVPDAQSFRFSVPDDILDADSIPALYRAVLNTVAGGIAQRAAYHDFIKHTKAIREILTAYRLRRIRPQVVRNMRMLAPAAAVLLVTWLLVLTVLVLTPS